MPKIIKKLILFCVLAFFILGALREPSYAQGIPNSNTVKTLENGLKLIIKEDHRNPIVAFSIFVEGGSSLEGEYSGSGISHLIEHLLFKGTKKYPRGAIENTLHKYGGDIEAYTSYDYTGFSITILKEHQALALDILKEMLFFPSFDNRELKKEMGVIKREMDLIKDSPSDRISRLAFSNAFTTHPYRIPIIGYKENFEKLTRSDVVKFFKSHYTPEKMVMAIVGDVKEEFILRDVESIFSKIPRQKSMPQALPEEPRQIQERFIEERASVEGVYLNIAFHSTDLLSDDLYAMDLLSFILGQGESSILNENLRMKKQLVLSIGSYNYTPKYPGLFIISSVLKEENTLKAISEILNEVEILKNNGVREEDLIKAKNNFLAGYIYQKETIESQANNLAQSELLTGSPDFFEKYIELIKLVTHGDIQRAAKKYLNKENMSVAILSKSGNILRSSTEKPLSKEVKEVERTLLTNNIPVLTSENHSLPMVAISILFKGGVRIEDKNNNGISLLMSSMLLDGTSSMTRDDIAMLYESKAISINPYSGNNSLGISATCLKEHLEATLKILSNLCMDSIFPEEELTREKNEMLSAIDMQDNEIFNHGHRLLKEMLFKSHPYRFQTIGNKESVNRLTRDDLLNFHKNILSPDNIVIGISGDFVTQEAMPIVERYFLGLPLKKVESVETPKEPPLDKRVERLTNVANDQSLIILGFHGINIYDKDKYALELLVNILSSPSGVLFKSIREINGLSYATGAFNALGIDPGYIVIYALTSKENINKAKDLMFKELALVIKNGASEEEIEKSKNYLKAMRKIGMQTNSNFILTISMDELYGMGYNNYKEFDRLIDSVTKDDLKRAAEKFLTPDKCAVLILEGK